MKTLHVALLGRFAVRLGDETITEFRSSKTRALLALLAMCHGEDESRDWLAGMLWPRLPQRAARTNLRVELSALERALSAWPGLQIERQTLRLAPEALQVDAVEALATLSRETDLRRPSAPDQLARALNACRGAFLEDIALTDALDFDSWVQDWRARIGNAVTAAAMRLQRHYAEAEDWPALLEAAHCHLRIDAWHETSHLHVMRALAATGDSAGALAQFERCRNLLAAELSVEPGPEIRTLADTLRARRARPPRLTNLTPRHTSLVGRDDLIQRVARHVLRDRLTTLLGLGGVGKTRLAQAVGEEAMGAFPDGVWFVPLAPRGRGRC